MTDSLDPIRHLATGRFEGNDNERLLAVALLKLADELVDMRNRVVSLELDCRAQGTRLNTINADRADLLRRVQHLELDRTDGARISAETSQHITDMANIVAEQITFLSDTVERITRLDTWTVSKIGQLIDKLDNIDGRVGQLEGL